MTWSKRLRTALDPPRSRAPQLDKCWEVTQYSYASNQPLFRMDRRVPIEITEDP